MTRRDIAGNWNIDIARDLEDYLEDLSKIQVSFGGKGKNESTTCNFAEAALLIQGSACVYSRKVESLYELVVLAINAITSSKNKKMKKKNSNDEAVLIDDARTFLTLDWPEEGSNIDLVDEKNGTGSNEMTMNGTPSALSTPRTAMRRRRRMLGLAPPPTMLMKSTPASLYPMLHANRAKAFRLSTCNIDRNTGALLMNTNANIFSATKGVAHPGERNLPSEVAMQNIQQDGDDDDGMDDVAFDGGDDEDYENGTYYYFFLSPHNFHS